MHTHCMIRDVLLSEKKIRLAFYNTYFALYIYIYYNIGKGTNILYNVSDVVTLKYIYLTYYTNESLSLII